MTFLAPLLLLAAAALVVPLLLHLFRKRAGAVRTFPALRYLERTSRERARIVRLRQLLLLALRLAALALLVFAAARLVLPVGGGEHPPAGVVLVVDNGITSGRVLDDRTVLDHLRDRAHAALDRTGSLDRIWVVPAGEPGRPAFPVDRDRARSVVDGLEPTSVRADLPAAVRRARSLLEAGAPPLRRILVLSDLHPSSVAGPADPHPADSIPVLVGTLGDSLPPNRGFADVTVGGGLAPRAGRGAELGIRIAGEPVEDQAVRLRVEGELVTAGRTDAAGYALLDLPGLAEGWASARVELDPDDLRADDVHHLAIPVRAPPRVVAVAGLPPHLEIALEILDERGRVERQTDAAGPAVLLDVGGGTFDGSRPTLVFPPADPALLPALNRRLADAGVGWRYEPAEPGRAGRVVEEAAPSLRIPAGIEVSLGHRIIPEDPDGATFAATQAPDGEVLARLSDGTPWIVRARAGGTGAGPPLLLVGSPPGPEASTLPTSAAMLPFLGAALELLDGGAPAPAIVAGASLPLPADAHLVSTPAGTRATVSGSPLFLGTHRAGIYEVLGEGGETLQRVAVNPAPAAADPARTPGAELAGRLGPITDVVPDARSWSRAVLRDRRGREVWWPLVLAALLVLVAEGWLAAGNGRGPGAAERGTTERED